MINPVDFDTQYGGDASLNLYNYLVEKSNNLRTTLFSDGRNLFSYYDANVLPKDSNKKIYIQTHFDDNKLLSFILTENGKEVYSFELPISLQTKGSFLNSKNELYVNTPIFEKDSYSLANILKDIFDIGEIKLNKIMLSKRRKSRGEIKDSG